MSKRGAARFWISCVTASLLVTLSGGGLVNAETTPTTAAPDAEPTPAAAETSDAETSTVDPAPTTTAAPAPAAAPAPTAAPTTVPEAAPTFAPTVTSNKADFIPDESDCDAQEVPNGETAECEILDDEVSGTLTVHKEVTNDDGGTLEADDFSFNLDNPAITPPGTGPFSFVNDPMDPLIGQLTLQVNAGTYTATEVAVDGYTSDDSDCVDVLVPDGGVASCTIINDDEPDNPPGAGLLVVLKTVINDDGGTLEADDFSFTVEPSALLPPGPGPFTFRKSPFNPLRGGRVLAVSSGEHTATEVAVEGYTSDDSDCAKVQVPNLGFAICTIINDDVPEPGTLIVNKTVINDDGGTLEADAFSFNLDNPAITPPGTGPFTFVNGTPTTTGSVSLTVGPGTYAATEVAVAGYTSDDSDCAAVVVPSGGSAECTITNDDEPGELVVNKEVTNDDGGTLEADDFSFSLDKDSNTPPGTGPFTFVIDPTDPLKGQLTLQVDAGSYTATEVAVAGYTSDDSDCVDVVVPNGEFAECTITNDDQPGTLIVNNVVTNDDGGILEADAFSFNLDNPAITPPGTGPFTFVNGTPTTTGSVSLTVAAGTYEATEVAVAGYISDDSDCAAVVVPNGGTASCTITNDDEPGTLVVNKVVVNDHGGTLEADAFSFNLDNPSNTPSGTGPFSFVNDLTDPLKGQLTLQVDAGTYTATEVAVDGYTHDDSDCVDVVVPLGGEAECTIENDDDAGTLIVHKEVTNDDGGTLEADAFSFDLDKPSNTPPGTGPFSFVNDLTDPLKGSVELSVHAGTYTATEVAVAGYTSDDSDCAEVVVPNGETAECTITNNDEPGPPPPPPPPPPPSPGSLVKVRIPVKIGITG